MSCILIIDATGILHLIAINIFQLGIFSNKNSFFFGKFSIIKFYRKLSQMNFQTDILNTNRQRRAMDPLA